MATTNNTSAIDASAERCMPESLCEQLGRSHDIRALIAGVKSIVEGLSEEQSEGREHAIRLLWKADKEMQLMANAIDSACLATGRDYRDTAFASFLAAAQGQAKPN